MIKTLLILAVAAHTTGNMSQDNGHISKVSVNFDQTPGFHEFADAIPGGDHLTFNFSQSTDENKSSWGNAGGLAYQWTTENNVHVGVGVNAGFNDEKKFGAGPMITMTYKFE